MNKLLLLSLLISLIPGTSAHAQIISTIAGKKGVGSYSGNGGPAIAATLNQPWGVAVDNAGNVYIGDGLNSVIRKIGPAGIISTVAGNGTLGYSGDNGPALAARFRYTSAVAVDNAGNVYISDHNNYVVRKIDPAGIITHFAGTGISGYNGDNRLASTAQITPGDLAVDASGNVYIADQGRIRKVDKAGVISTVAGNGKFGSSGDGGAATDATIGLGGLAVDQAGNLYIAEPGNARVRKVNRAGIITTIAGNGVHDYNGDGGPATSAAVDDPYDVAVDGAGNIYIAHYQHHVIRKVDPSGIITTIAGRGRAGYSGDGGPASAAELTWPVNITVDNNGNIYFPDVTNHTVRKITGCITATIPTLSIEASATSICKNTPVTFIVTSMNGGSSPVYQWKVNGMNAGTNSSQFTTNALSDGDIVSCSMMSSIPCNPIVLSTNTIKMNVNPLPMVITGPDKVISPGNSVRLTLQTTGSISQYHWSPSTGLSDPSVPDPVASPVNTTAYNVKVVSDKGCTAQAKILVTVYKRLTMPSAFTPNHDLKNDVFRIPPGTTLDLKSFSVYSRWGNLLFKTNDINQGWDGNYRGTPCIAGAYVFVISGNDPVGGIFLKGSFLLIR